MAGKGSQRACAVIGCTNSGKKLFEWRNAVCAIHLQPHDSCPCPEPYRLLPFPSSRTDPDHPRLLNAWVRLVNRTYNKGKDKGKQWQPNSDSRICSQHFVSYDHYYPILNMGHQNIPDAFKLSKRKPIKRRHVELEALSDENMSNSPEPEVEEKAENFQACFEKDLEISKLKQQVTSLQGEIKTLKESCKSGTNISRKLDVNDPHLKQKGKMTIYTGMTKVMFDSVYDAIQPEAKKLRYWRGPKRTVNPARKSSFKSGQKRKLTTKNEFFMEMFKLKVGLHMSIIGDLFGVSQTQVSRTCFTWWTFLATAVGSLVYNPEKGAVLKTMPKSFKTPLYSDVRHIVDCTEVFIETPKSLLLAASCWSDYKHHHTVKYLVSINPNGHINYISKGWGVRTSDNYITEHCGFLDILEPYDRVMADRGFQIQKLLAQQFVTLVLCKN